jgi:peptidoglycan/xylan/chitin deacetylase (PgdA/CDA1 family)
VRPSFATRQQDVAFHEIAGASIGSVALDLTVFDLALAPADEIVVAAAGTGMPLVVRRGVDTIVNFDLHLTRECPVLDSKRPIYTYLPRFNIHSVPERIRRPISNFVESTRIRANGKAVGDYGRLPLTDFEAALILLRVASCDSGQDPAPIAAWPYAKRAMFVSLHDVDTDRLLTQGERNPLFRIEAKHNLKSTWFVPSYLSEKRVSALTFLSEAGHEVGWHGHKHDHRDHVPGFADEAVAGLLRSPIGGTSGRPIGMRLPKLLKSRYLFRRIEERCPTLKYDTSFVRGVLPYRLWLDGRESSILEIPTTVPTDIRLHNELHGVPNVKRADKILQSQVCRTEQLIKAGAVISIVTHPERTLSERPDLLDAYDQFLSYIQGRDDIWFAKAGELFSYWTARLPSQHPHPVESYTRL